MKLKLPSSAPPCPHCHSTFTDRLPFEAKNQSFPIYSCIECGHVWREHERRLASQGANPH